MFSFIQGEFDNVYDKKDAAKQPMILTKSNLGKQRSPSLLWSCNHYCIVPLKCEQNKVN